MSMFLDVSNFPVDNKPQKYKFFDEFEHLVALNQGFINNYSTNNNSNAPTYDDHLDTNNVGDRNEGKLLNLVEQNLKPDGKCSNIGNFNVYNRCVFFINNSEGNGHLENQFKLSKTIASAKECGRKISTARNGVRRPVNFREDKPNEKRFKLLYLHKDSLRPILSPDIKPGIYRRCLNKEVINENGPKRSENNVCVSHNEEKGRILANHEFHEKYVKVGDECILKSKQTEFAVHYVHQINGGILNEFTEVCPENLPHEMPQECNSQTPTGRTLSVPSNGNDIILKRDSNEIIFKSSESGKEVVFKVIHPNLLELEDVISSKKDTSNTVKQPNADQAERSLLKLRRKTPSRKKTPKIESQPEPAIATAVTRYGRISKPPKHAPHFKIPILSEEKEAPSFQGDNDEDFKYSREIVPDPITFDANEVRLKRKRDLPPHYTCASCNKIYLGRRMQEHLEANPSHGTFQSPKENHISTKLSLYNFLVEKIKQTPDEHRTDLFLSEISDLVNQLQIRGSRFVRNTSGVHFVNSQTAKVLGIPEGHYSIDVSAIDCIPDSEPTIEDTARSIIPPPPPRLDYNLSISLDDTISDAKLNLPDNMIASEESLLRTVDDLVVQGINNLREHDTAVMHYDHASDNAVEAASIKAEQPPPILDLSLDLFQFGSN